MLSEFALCSLLPSSLPGIVSVDADAEDGSWQASSFEAEFLNPCSRYFGVYCGELLIGYALIQLFAPEAQVLKLAVRHSYRRRGVARTILEGIHTELSNEAVDSAWLEVRERNLAAQSLYRSLGFKPIAVRKDYYSSNGENAIVMRCDYASLCTGGISA